MLPLSKQTRQTGLIRFITAGVFVIFFLASNALCHGIKIAVRMDNNALIVESALRGHRLASGSAVVIRENLSKKVLIKGTVENKGVYMVPLPAELLSNPVDLLISVSDQYGHHAKTVVKHELYEGLLPAKQKEEKAQSLYHQLEQGQLANEDLVSQETLRRMMEELLEKKLSPIRSQLANLDKDRVSFIDIIGGIGYLIGLAGLAAWMKSKG